MKSFRLPFVVEISLVVMFSLLVVISCGPGTFRTELYIKNEAKNPFHIVDYYHTIDIRISVNNRKLIKTFDEDVDGNKTFKRYIMRDDRNLAQLTITPLQYPEDDSSNYIVTVTITEDPPFTFHASVMGDALLVDFENLNP